MFWNNQSALFYVHACIGWSSDVRDQDKLKQRRRKLIFCEKNEEQASTTSEENRPEAGREWLGNISQPCMLPRKYDVVTIHMAIFPGGSAPSGTVSGLIQPRRMALKFDSSTLVIEYKEALTVWTSPKVCITRPTHYSEDSPVPWQFFYEQVCHAYHLTICMHTNRANCDTGPSTSMPIGSVTWTHASGNSPLSWTRYIRRFNLACMHGKHSVRSEHTTSFGFDPAYYSYVMYQGIACIHV